MGNPWLNIPLDDYESHMSLAAVGQAQMIAEQLDRALERCSPASISVMGCAAGNGLDIFERRAVERVVAVDVNPDYIERARAGYALRLPGLELVCADVASASLIYDPVDLTYAALLFEYVDALATLRQFSGTLGPTRFSRRYYSLHIRQFPPSRLRLTRR